MTSPSLAARRASRAAAHWRPDVALTLAALASYAGWLALLACRTISGAPQPYSGASGRYEHG